MELFNDRLELVKRFAMERHGAFIRKMNPETDALVPNEYPNAVLQQYKFTNVFRVLDRTTQGVVQLINHSEPTVNLVHQIYLYKMFNSLDTWRRIPSIYRAEPAKYLSEIFDWANNSQQTGEPVFSRAYLLCTGQSWLPLYMSSLESLIKHEHHCKTLLGCDKLSTRYDIMIQYPGFGEFLAYQFALDFSYIRCYVEAYEWFVVPGPGCMRGMKKVYGDVTKAQAARVCAELAERNYFGIVYRGHKLRGNDVQNIFCEFDKYSRVAHPELGDKSMRIKNYYKANHEPYNIEWPVGWIYGGEND